MLNPLDLHRHESPATADVEVDADVIDLDRRRTGRSTTARRAPTVTPSNGTPTVAQMDLIIDRYDDGQSLATVACEVGFTVEAVHRSLRRSGLLRTEDEGRRGPASTEPSDDVEPREGPGPAESPS